MKLPYLIVLFFNSILFTLSCMEVDSDKQKKSKSITHPLQQIPFEVCDYIDVLNKNHSVSRQNYSDALECFKAYQECKKTSVTVQLSDHFLTDEKLAQYLQNPQQDNSRLTSTVKSIKESIKKKHSTDRLFTIEDKESGTYYIIKNHFQYPKNFNYTNLVKIATGVYFWKQKYRIFYQEEKFKDFSYDLNGKKHQYLSKNDFCLAYHHAKQLIALFNENEKCIDIVQFDEPQKQIIYNHPLESIKNFRIIFDTQTVNELAVAPHLDKIFSIFDKNRPYLYLLMKLNSDPTNQKIMIFDYEKQKEYSFKIQLTNDAFVKPIYDKFFPMNIIALSKTLYQYYDLEQGAFLEPCSLPEKSFCPRLAEYNWVDKVIFFNSELIAKAKKWLKNKKKTLKKGQDTLASLKALGPSKYIILWATTNKEKKFNLFKTIHEKVIDLENS